MTVFPYRASAISASIEWLNDVAKSYTTERRYQVRAQPRLVLNLGIELTGDRTRKAQAIIDAGDGFLTVPDWRYEQPIAAGFAAASLAVTIDAAYFTPAVGDPVIVWQDADNFTETTVVSIVSNTLTLADGPAVAYGIASVLPALSCVVTSQLSTSQSLATFGTASLGVTVTDYADLSPHFAGNTYDGKYVPGRDVLVQAQSGGIVLGQSRVDMGLGPIQPVRVRTINDWRYSLQLVANTKIELLQAEAVFHTLAGRLVPFWRPTWLQDFTLNANAPAAQSYIRVDVVAPGTDIPAIALERADGTTEFFGVTSWATVGSYTQINFDAALAADFDIADVLTISIMRLSRLDTDKISFKFGASGDAMASAATVGIVE